MFDVAKDERMRTAMQRAGAIAFYCMWAATLLLMMTSMMTDVDPLGDPSFMLGVPFLVGTFTYVIMSWTAGVYSTFRDEATRSPGKLKETRWRLAVGTVLYAGVMFLIKRSDILDHDIASLRRDVIDTLVVTIISALWVWFMLARKGRRQTEKTED